jgi:hypothetical protein
LGSQVSAGLLEPTPRGSLKLGKRGADFYAVCRETEFPDRVLMRAAAFFDDGNRAPDPAFRLEIPQHQNRIAQITDVERRLHRPHQPVLS